MNRTDTLFPSILASVFAAHCLLVFLCCFSPFTWTQQPKQKAARQRLVVQTVALATPTVSAQAQKTENRVITHTKPTEQAPKPVSKSISTSAKPVAKPTPKIIEPVSTKNTAARQQLLQKAKENLSKALSTTATSSIKQEQTAASKTAPKLIGELKSDTLIAQADSLSGNTRETSYQEELVSRLQTQLQLPEYGTVDIELTLERSGKFIKLKVLRDESVSNRRYIEKNVPTMRFPHFGSSFEGKAEFTFVIRLSNAI